MTSWDQSWSQNNLAFVVNTFLESLANGSINPMLFHFLGAGYPRAPEEAFESGRSIILPQNPHEPSDVDDALPVVVITPSSVMSVSPTIQLSSIVINPKWDRNPVSSITTSQRSNDEKELFYNNNNKNNIRSVEATTATPSSSTSAATTITTGTPRSANISVSHSVSVVSVKFSSSDEKTNELEEELSSTLLPTPLSTRVHPPPPAPAPSDTLIELPTSSDRPTNESRKPLVHASATRRPQRESQISSSRTKESELSNSLASDEAKSPSEAGETPESQDGARSNQITSDRDPKSLLIPPSSFGSALSSMADSPKSEKSIPSGNDAGNKDSIVLHPVILRLSRNQSYALTSSSASDPKQIFEFVSPNQKDHVTSPTPRTPRSPASSIHAPTALNSASTSTTPVTPTTTTIGTTTSRTTVTTTATPTTTPMSTVSTQTTTIAPTTTTGSTPESQLPFNHHNHHHHYTIPKSSIDLDVRSLLQEYNITDLELDRDEANDYSNYPYAEGRSLNMELGETEDTEYNEFDRDESDELLRIYDRVRDNDSGPKNPNLHEEVRTTQIGGQSSDKVIMSDGGALSAQSAAAVVEENVLGVQMVGHERPVESFNASVIIGIAVGAVVFVLLGLGGCNECMIRLKVLGEKCIQERR